MALIPSFFGGGSRRNNIFDPFSLDVWDPFEGFPIGGAVANVPSSVAKDASALANVRIDWRETPEAHIIKADLPGLDKREVKVEIEEDGRILQISGERSREREEKDDKWHRVERSVGRFVRRFRLPENARVDQVKATMENGVLTVVIPKQQEKKAESRPIHISGGCEGGGGAGFTSTGSGGRAEEGGFGGAGATGGGGGGAGVFDRDRPTPGGATGEATGGATGGGGAGVFDRDRLTPGGATGGATGGGIPGGATGGGGAGVFDRDRPTPAGATGGGF